MVHCTQVHSTTPVFVIQMYTPVAMQKCVPTVLHPTSRFRSCYKFTAFGCFLFFWLTKFLLFKQVVARYTMGWWPVRICCLFNLVIMLGYGLVDILISGQILSYVNGQGLSVIVGVIVSAVVTLLVVLFGIRLFHTYERYAWIPQAIVLFIMVGVSGPYWSTSSATVGDGPEKAADRMSFFFLAVSAAVAWAPSAADFYVYFPPRANRLAIFAATTLGLGMSCTFTYLIGVGVASAVQNKPEWNAAYEVGAGALIVEVFRPLGAFGDFCAVIIALGLIANNIPGTYSSAMSWQLLGSWFAKLPRLYWTVFGVILYTVCACAGRDHLFDTFQNFLALLGYFVTIWIAITLEEEFIFRRHRGGFDWTAWNDKKKLPIGIAAFTAFCIGWVGSVLGMWQTYFTGPLGKTVGFGIDMGIPLGTSWAAVAFPPLRWLELKYVGR